MKNDKNSLRTANPRDHKKKNNNNTLKPDVNGVVQTANQEHPALQLVEISCCKL